MFKIKVRDIEESEISKEPVWNKIMDKLGLEIWVK